MQTVLDEKVRKTWKLDPSKFVINNPEWDKGIQELVFKIGETLGFERNSTKARLYKFLLYDKGSHFKVGIYYSLYLPRIAGPFSCDVRVIQNEKSEIKRLKC